MLEDNFTDVLRKALLGHGMSPAQAAARAGLDPGEIGRFLDGVFSGEIAERLASLLGLNPAAFRGHPLYQPVVPQLPGVRRLVLPFSGDHVNAWLLDGGEGGILFDTGAGEECLLGPAGAVANVALSAACITHSHRDHIGGVGELSGAGVNVLGPNGCPGVTIRAGDERALAGMRVRACDLSGHCEPALGYHVDGLELPVLVTGDALFAGSIGGCPTPARYQLALRTLREALDGLPDETVLLPGHGPATTLGAERRFNPFL